MKKLILIMAFMMVVVTNCHGLTKTYALVNGQDDKSELDAVEVNIIKTETFVDTRAKTATEIRTRSPEPTRRLDE